MEVKKYVALVPVNHDQKRYETGDTLELEDVQAEPLLTLNAIEGTAPVEETAPKAKSKAS